MRTSVVALLYLALVIFSRHFGFCACVYSLVVEDKIKMASSSDDEEGNSWERFDNLCRDLNMDEETSQEAWSSYQKISTNYTLEVPFVCVRLRSLHVCFESYV